MITGIVLDAQRTPVAGAKVRLQRQNNHAVHEEVTDGKGVFNFSVADGDAYSLVSEMNGRYSRSQSLTSSRGTDKIELVLDQAATAPGDNKQRGTDAVQFADQPDFTVAGVTDFTAAGGHGSDSSLRTSEALAARTSTLKANVNTPISPPDILNIALATQTENRLKADVARSPDAFIPNHNLGAFYERAGRYQEAVRWLEAAYRIDKTDPSNEYDLAVSCEATGDAAHAKTYVEELLTVKENADLHRLMGKLDEDQGNSLAAVREYQRAVSLEPTEQNFFSWGSELLVHRAIWQAQQVFEQGVKQYPRSSRMLTGLGTALFAGAAYDEAAARLCEASDLEPTDREPFIFMGKVQIASPHKLECIQQRLEQFLQQDPADATANYLFAMALQKRSDNAQNPYAQEQSRKLLEKAISINPNYSEAYLQLGILLASRGDFSQAIDTYLKGIAADPNQSDIYYRLAVAYDRTGQSAKAKENFRLHDQVATQQATEIERQREEVKQFVVMMPTQAPVAKAR